MNNKQLASDLYDIIRLARLPKTQNDEWAELTRKHAHEAKGNIKKALGNKNISVEGSTITIGQRKPLTITITQ